MATSPWKDITQVQPTDGQFVWIRRLFFENPVKATYFAINQTFTTVTGFDIPAFIVSRWRPV